MSIYEQLMKCRCKVIKDGFELIEVNGIYEYAIDKNIRPYRYIVYIGKGPLLSISFEKKEFNECFIDIEVERNIKINKIFLVD